MSKSTSSGWTHPAQDLCSLAPPKASLDTVSDHWSSGQPCWTRHQKEPQVRLTPQQSTLYQITEAPVSHAEQGTSKNLKWDLHLNKVHCVRSLKLRSAMLNKAQARTSSETNTSTKYTVSDHWSSGQPCWTRHQKEPQVRLTPQQSTLCQITEAPVSHAEQGKSKNLKYDLHLNKVHHTFWLKRKC